MAGKKYNTIGSDWENSVIREAIVELNDPEALRIYDEEQERLDREAQEELKRWKDRGCSCRRGIDDTFTG